MRIFYVQLFFYLLIVQYLRGAVEPLANFTFSLTEKQFPLQVRQQYAMYGNGRCLAFLECFVPLPQTNQQELSVLTMREKLQPIKPVSRPEPSIPNKLDALLTRITRIACCVSCSPKDLNDYLSKVTEHVLLQFISQKIEIAIVGAFNYEIFKKLTFEAVKIRNSTFNKDRNEYEISFLIPPPPLPSPAPPLPSPSPQLMAYLKACAYDQDFPPKTDE